MTELVMQGSLLARFKSYTRSFPPQALLVGVYLFVVVAVVATLAPLLTSSTTYGLGYRLWFAAVVETALAITLAPFAGAVAGGIDYDLGVSKELHLAGRRLFVFQLRTLGATSFLLLALVAIGLLCALGVSLFAAVGVGALRGDGDLMPASAVLRLCLAVVVGIPFATLLGWVAGAVFRCSYCGALVVQATLFGYLLVGRFVSRDAKWIQPVFRFSPWGALFAMATGNYRYPVLAFPPVLSVAEAVLAILAWCLVLLITVWLVTEYRDRVGAQQ